MLRRISFDQSLLDSHANDEDQFIHMTATTNPEPVASSGAGAQSIPAETEKHASPAQSSLLHKHMPELDVLRGIAVASVILYHGIYWTQTSQPGGLAAAITSVAVSGWLGVNLFFVLSGFLITGILLDTKHRPGYFSSFYIRRALRILPAYVLIILVLIATRMTSAGGVLLSSAFLANYWRTLAPHSIVYGPFWSLSVEEQFYLLWPLILFLLPRRYFTMVAVGLCFLAPILRWSVSTAGASNGPAHVATWLIADNLAIGAVAALFLRSRYGTKRNALVVSALLILAAAFTLAVGMPYGILHRSSRIGAALQTMPFNFLFTAMLLGLLALRPRILVGKLFWPLRLLGDISYGLYLVHLIVFEEYDRHIPHPATWYGHFGAEMFRLFVCLTVAIGLAWLSRRYYEEPFLRLKSKLAPSSPKAERAPA
jgi:peptidoglycan/LPS O-acetylase OafA/YrhL